MSVAPVASVTAAPPAQAVTGAGDVAPAAPEAAPTSALTGPATSTTPQSATPSPPADPILQAVDVARAAAAGRQASLAPLLADLAQAIASPALSGQTKAAIAQVLALQTPIDGEFTAQVVKEAVAQSGLFLEAHLASLPLSGATPPDLKAALLVLQRALAAVPASAVPAAPRALTAPPPAGQGAPALPNAPATPAPSLTPPASAAARVPAETPAALPAQPEPVLAQAPTPQTPSAAPLAAPAAKDAIATPGLVAPAADAAPATVSVEAPAQAAGLPARSAAPTPPQSTSAAPSTRQTQAAPNAAPAVSPLALTPPKVPVAEVPQTPSGTLLAAQVLEEAIPETVLPPETDVRTLAPPREDPPLDAHSALLLLQRAFGGAPAARPGPPSRSAAPPPPLRQSAPSAQAAEPAALPAGDEAVIAQHLAGETDQALARLTLHQLASLPDAAGGPAWVFELPLATPQGAAMAQFVIDHDEEAATGSSSGPAWRARFSIDVEPLGPVHVHLRVGQDSSAVTMWAEREGGVERLRGQGSALAQALNADVVIHPGAPRRSAPPPGPGQFVDQSS